MTPLTIRITPGGITASRGLSSDRHVVTEYRAAEDAEWALVEALRGIDAFAGPKDNLSMVCESLASYAPDLCDIAGDVSAIRALERAFADRDLTADESQILDRLRCQTENPWIRRRAGQLLVLIGDHRDQHAVCGASEVGG